MNEDKKQEKALLIGFYRSQDEKQSCQEHLEELHFLINTFGVQEADLAPVSLRKIDPGIYMGSGKLQELVEKANLKKYDLIVFDEEISPTQQRNLEKAFQRPVMERTEIILGVFAQRAQTKEAKLQIELAQAHYQLPRLKRLWTHLSRQKGGALYLKGEGEKQIEIDRRLLKREIHKLEKNLEKVKRIRQTQRSQRMSSGTPTIAIIGYTNAGKSTLLHKLTEANVFIEDKLFATLDTTTKKFTLPSGRQILLIDTVGFIRKIPHSLVAAFKSTLEESLYTDVLLHLIDASHPLADEHGKAALEVLKELKITGKPIITVLNKMDKVTEETNMNKLRLLFPNTIKISAETGEGLEELLAAIEQTLKERCKTLSLRIPQEKYALYAALRKECSIIEEEYDENDICVTASCPLEVVSQFIPYSMAQESK